MSRAGELRQREVINITNAERLGFINDVEIDLESGRIRAIVIPERRSLLNLFFRRNDHIIPWEKIVSIGREIVLVRLDGIDVVK